MLKTSSTLRALPGNRLVIRPHHAGAPERDAEVLDVLGKDGGPPFLVRWQDDGRVSRFYPSSDAYIDHLAHAEPAPQDGDLAEQPTAQDREAPPPVSERSTDVP